MMSETSENFQPKDELAVTKPFSSPADLTD
jgi:hypothetical protein